MGVNSTANSGDLYQRIASLEEQVALLKHQNRLFVSFMQTTEHTLTALRTSNFAVTAGYGTGGSSLAPAINRAAAAAAASKPGGARSSGGGGAGGPTDIQDLMKQYKMESSTAGGVASPATQPQVPSRAAPASKQAPKSKKAPPPWNGSTDPYPSAASADANGQFDDPANDEPPAPVVQHQKRMPPAAQPKHAAPKPVLTASKPQVPAPAPAAARAPPPQRAPAPRDADGDGDEAGGYPPRRGGGGGRAGGRDGDDGVREGDGGDGGDGEDDEGEGEEDDRMPGAGGDDGVPDDPFAGANEPRGECPHCHRKFAQTALARHVEKRACMKAAKKRKVFNMKTRRAAEGKVEGKKQDEAVVEQVVAQKSMIFHSVLTAHCSHRVSITGSCVMYNSCHAVQKRNGRLSANDSVKR